MTEEETVFLENLYATYVNKLVVYARATLDDKGKAQDVVQDTFHEAALKIAALMVHPNPGGWLMQTLKYKIKGYNRARKRYSALPFPGL